MRKTKEELLEDYMELSEKELLANILYRLDTLLMYENMKHATKYPDEDIQLVSQQAGVDEEKARNAVEEAKGDLARAILLLTSG